MAVTTDPKTAYDLLMGILNTYGLGSLGPTLEALVKEETDQEVLLYRLRETPQYQARFPALKELNARGIPFSERDYFEYETRANQLETKYELPSGFLSSPDRIANMLRNDIDADDLTRRVELNYASSLNAPAEVRQELERLYGVGQGGVAAYYLDPDNALGYLERVAASTAIAAEGRRQDFTLTRESAERYAALGYQQGEARRAFETAASLSGLTSGYDTVGQQDLVDAAFGNVSAGQRVEQATAARTGRFQAGGGAAGGNEGVAGLGAAGTS